MPNFPDPSQGGGIKLTPSTGIDPRSPAFQAAQQACKAYAPGGPTPVAMSESQRLKAVAFAKCMRSHGQPNFPGPQLTTENGRQTVRQGLPGSAGLSPVFEAAQRLCGRIFGPPTNSGSTQGQPKTQDLVAFAQWVRSHGFSLIPTGRENLTLQMFSAAGIDYHGPAFAQAAESCVGASRGAVPR